MEKKIDVSLVTDVFPLNKGMGVWPSVYGPFFTHEMDVMGLTISN